MAQAGVAEPVGQAPVVAFGLLAVEQQGQPLAMVEFADISLNSVNSLQVDLTTPHNA